MSIELGDLVLVTQGEVVTAGKVDGFDDYLGETLYNVEILTDNKDEYRGKTGVTAAMITVIPKLGDNQAFSINRLFDYDAIQEEDETQETEATLP